MTPPAEQRLQALNEALTDSARIIRELAMTRNGLLKDNNALRLKLVQALEHLQTSRAHAMILAEELEKYRKP